MKQQITKKQWDELSNNQKVAFEKGISTALTVLNDKKKYHDYPTPLIGQMMEFLGKSLTTIHNFDGEQSSKAFEDTGEIDVEDSELADVLWEACKYKLRKIV